MGLRETAELDLVGILEDEDGFAWDITLTDPSAVGAPLRGFSNDISQVIDPDTGDVVSGRSASVALSMSSITAAGLGMPQSIASSGVKPWLVTFNDIRGVAYTFKVLKSNPDRGHGLVTLILETYT